MPEEPEEQLEFLRREDIRTMAKDTARLREEESKKERERIVQLQGASKGQQTASPGQAQPAATPEPLGRSPMGEPSPVSLVPSELPKPPSKTKKIIVRVAIILLILFIAANVVALAYSFWKGADSKQQEQNQPPRQTPEETLSPQEESLLPFPVEKIVAIYSPRDLSELLSEDLPQGIIGISFAYEAPPSSGIDGIGLPEQVRSLVQPPLLPFLHILGEKKRLGFVFSIGDNEEAMEEAVLQWEPDMEEGMAPFFWPMGGPGAGYVSFFRSTQRNEVPIRFQTFSRDDVGIVYAISHNLFIITSSLESMNVLLDALEKPAL